jgi:hypothetical protein
MGPLAMLAFHTNLLSFKTYFHFLVSISLNQEEEKLAQ